MSSSTPPQKKTTGVWLWTVTGERHKMSGGIGMIRLLNEAADWLKAGDRKAPIAQGAKLVILSRSTRGFGKMLLLWSMCRSDDEALRGWKLRRLQANCSVTWHRGRLPIISARLQAS